MRTIEQLRAKHPNSETLTDTDLAVLLGNGSKRHSQMQRMLSRGELIRVKRGLYIFGDLYRKNPVSLFYLSNIIYGPSYVSLESALSYHDLIPEGVVNVTAVNPTRTYEVNSSLGQFTYRKIPKEAFPKDVLREESEGSVYLVASKEKCLLDKLYLDSTSNFSKEFIVESLRIDPLDLQSLNTEKLLELSTYYNNKIFNKRVVRLIRELVNER